MGHQLHSYKSIHPSTPLKLLSFCLKNPVLLSQSVHDFNWPFFLRKGRQNFNWPFLCSISQPSVLQIVFVINNFMVFSVGRSVRMQYVLRRHSMFPLRIIVSLCFRLHTFFYYQCGTLKVKTKNITCLSKRIRDFRKIVLL